MSGAVKISTPPVRLAKLLRTPGGLPVAEAVQRAGAGLQTLKGDCVAELQSVLDAAEACVAAAKGGYDAAIAAQLYEIVSKSIGVASICDLEAADTVLISLADLVDYLNGQVRWDAEAITVHLGAFRLLLRADAADKAGAEAVLAGLRKVTQRYAG